MTIPLPSTGPASAKAIEELVRRFGALPTDYRAFLSHSDGARPGPNLLPLANGGTQLAEFIRAENIPDTASEIDGFPANAMPIAADEAGNYIYLLDGSQGVFFWDHEVEGGDQKIAQTFAEFLEKLQPADIGSVQLQPGQVKRVWVDPDFKPTF